MPCLTVFATGTGNQRQGNEGGDRFSDFANSFAMSGLGQGTTSPGDISGIMQQLSDPNIQSGMAEFMGSEFGQQMLTSAAENNPQIRGLLDANPGMRYVPA